MKRFAYGLISTTLTVLPVIALAQVRPTEPPWTQPDTGLTFIFDRVLNSIFSIFVVVAAIMLVVAAFFFLTAQGDPDKVKKARDFVLYAVIGAVVAFAAKILVWTAALIVGNPQ